MRDGSSPPRDRFLLAAPLIAAGALLLGIAYNVYHLPRMYPDTPLIPHYGHSHQQAIASYFGERDWTAYTEIKRHFSGWTLIGFDTEAVLFSAMYSMNYSGPTKTRVVAYDPDLSPAESASLETRLTVRRMRSIRAPIGVVPPDSNARNRVAIALRGSNGLVMIVPVDSAPPRFAALAHDR